MADIAVAVGLKKPSLYHYFGGKVDILVAMHDEYETALAQHLAECLADTSLTTASDQLRRIVRDLLNTVITHAGHLRVSMENERELPAKARSSIRARRRAYLAGVEQIIQKGIESGEFRAVDASLTTYNLLGMCAWTYHWYNPDGPVSEEELAAFMWESVVVGMKNVPVEPVDS
jgi:AcrR family transcriptional regulator